MDPGTWLEIVIQLCRLQVQREREKLTVTPKMRGALESLKQLQSHVDNQSEKLTRRISDEVMPKITQQFTKAHSNVDTMVTSVGEISDFGDEIEGKLHNGGDPLDGSKSSSGNTDDKSPRSSEVAGQ